MKIKSFVKIVVVTIFIVIILALALGLGLYIMNRPMVSRDTAAVLFTVKKGDSLHIISRQLEDDKLIRSAFFFTALGKVLNTEKAIVAGTYMIQPSASTIDIYNLLLKGDFRQIKLTIPEGWTMSRIAEAAEKEQVCAKADLVKLAKSREFLEKFGIPGEDPEGFLFPDTYHFPPDSAPEVVLGQLITNFYTHLATMVPDYKKWDRQKLYDKIILASIIEREYRVPGEAPLIASVFYNRMQVNMGLESCATLEYIITEKLNQPHPKSITMEHKKIKSPYNTYMWYGLPPGPISNPGMVALKASFFPAKTDYWYFVLKNSGSGEHEFTKSLDAHIKAKYQYLKD
jgi:UPF0755 protein